MQDFCSMFAWIVFFHIGDSDFHALCLDTVIKVSGVKFLKAAGECV